MNDSIEYNVKSDMDLHAFTQPNYAWKCQLHKDTWWHVEEGKQPNTFHRFMQRLCFGLKWEKIDD